MGWIFIKEVLQAKRFKKRLEQPAYGDCMGMETGSYKLSVPVVRRVMYANPNGVCGGQCHPKQVPAILYDARTHGSDTPHPVLHFQDAKGNPVSAYLVSLDMTEAEMLELVRNHDAGHHSK